MGIPYLIKCRTLVLNLMRIALKTEVYVVCFRAFADARVQPIYGGTNEIMKELIARNIVSQK